MADVRVVSSLLAGATISAAILAQIHAALAAKDASELSSLLATQPSISQACAEGLKALLQLYGDGKVLAEAEKAFKLVPAAVAALQDMRWLASHVVNFGGAVKVGFDLADLRGYAYYSGTRFAIYGQGAELARGGRYDEVGAIFGRRRPAAGFSLDLKELVSVLTPRPLRAAVCAPWGVEATLRQAIAGLRARGETVVCVLPGHEHEINEFDCDRELAQVAGQWIVQPLRKTLV
jgi:ATP phosphoribosyltransferase regulatory subunit